MTLTRRDALKGIGVAVGTAAFGCGDAGAPGGADPDGGATGADAGVDAVDARVIDAPSADALLAPIDTFVVLMMENRSFDHYLGALARHEGFAVDGLTGTEMNLSNEGLSIYSHRLDDYTPADLPHDWDSCHAQWNQGQNDGFVRAHAGSYQADAMGYHVREQLPITYALADGGAICERYFASVMGPTWPNRFYLHGGSANGMKLNLPVLGFRSIWSVLDDAGLTHKNYFHDIAWAVGGYAQLTGNAPIEEFFRDAAAGTLPTFSIIDPKFFGSGANDDHPDHDVRLGQALISSVVRALGTSPQWQRCLLVVTYDEHGGFFDHVPPPTTVDASPDFRQLGFRVPTLVLGPGARRRQVVRTTFEHASILATLNRRFGLAPLNERVAAAADLSPCLDPGWLTSPQPAPELPTLTMSRAAIRARPASHAHAELAAIADAMALPPHLDRRGRDAEVTAAFLGEAERLGAIRLTP